MVAFRWNRVTFSFYSGDRETDKSNNQTKTTKRSFKAKKKMVSMHILCVCVCVFAIFAFCYVGLVGWLGSRPPPALSNWYAVRPGYMYLLMYMLRFGIEAIFIISRSTIFFCVCTTTSHRHHHHHRLGYVRGGFFFISSSHVCLFFLRT